MAYLREMMTQTNVLLYENQNIMIPLQELCVVIEVNYVQVTD